MLRVTLKEAEEEVNISSPEKGASEVTVHSDERCKLQTSED